MTTFQAVIAIALIFVIAWIAIYWIHIKLNVTKSDGTAGVKPSKPWPKKVRDKYEPGELKSEKEKQLRLDLIRQFHEVE